MPRQLGECPQVAAGGNMTIRPLRNTFLACLMLGAMIAGAKAAECDGAITADEALKAEDARYAAQTHERFRRSRAPVRRRSRLCSLDGRHRQQGKLHRAPAFGLHYRVMRPSDVKVRVFGCLAIITGRGDYEVTQNGQDTARTCCSPPSGRSAVQMCSLFLGNPRPFPSRKRARPSSKRSSRP